MFRLDSLDELRLFAQVVESGSIAAAADVLRIHPSTASRRLATLEERVGKPLLHRTTRRQSLSETGRALLGQVQRLLREADAAELLLEEEAEGLSGLVKVGVVTVLAYDILEAIGPLLHANPKLQIQVRVDDRVANPVTAGLDVVLRGGRLGDSTLIARKLLDFTVALAASRSYLERHGTPERPADLQHHQALWTPTNPRRTSWNLVDEHGEHFVVEAQGQLEVDGGIPMVEAMRHGLGIGSTSPRMIRRHPDLVRVLPTYEVGTFPFYAIYPSSGQRSSRLQAVVEALKDALDRQG